MAISKYFFTASLCASMLSGMSEHEWEHLDISRQLHRGQEVMPGPTLQLSEDEINALDFHVAEVEQRLNNGEDPWQIMDEIVNEIRQELFHNDPDFRSMWRELFAPPSEA